MDKPNVIFILIDALRAKSLHCYGYPRETSPNIDAIAQRGVLFTNNFCTVNASDPSLTTILSGLSPHTHGIIHHGDQIPKNEVNFFNSQNVQLLPEIMKLNGYKTFGLDWLGRWHRRGYDYYAGFNVDRVGRKKMIKDVGKWLDKAGLYTFFKKMYYNPFFRKLIGKFDLYNEDVKLTAQATDIISKQESPFFMFIHYWGLHAPYNCPKKYFDELKKTPSPIIIPEFQSFSFIKNEKYREFYEQWTKGQPFSDIIVRHDGAIKQIDAQIGQLIDTLKLTGKLDNTMIVITSDHGESLVEHNIFFDHHGLYDASTHVPLIISFPGIKTGKIISLVQHTDITPTILSLLNVQPSRQLDGFDLTPLIDGTVQKVHDYVILEENYYQQKECIRTLQHKFIRTVGSNECSRCGMMHGDEIELYDLQSDPLEYNNIAKENYELVQELSNKLDEHKQQQPVKEAAGEMELLNKAIREIEI